MITRKPIINTLFASVLRPSISQASSSPYICVPCQQRQRSLSSRPKAGNAPSPTPFVPDVQTFLTLIGRQLSQHASKFKSWQDLFSLSSSQLKELGIEPPRSRKYLLRWREKFKNGEFGIGGDFNYVTDGVGEVRVIEVPQLKSREGNTEGTVSTSQTPGMTKLILNVPHGATRPTLKDGQKSEDLKKPKGFSLRNGHTIVGSFVQPMKGANGSAATLKVQEGMWEDKRGHKVHGGERRRAETLHKLAVAERKKNAR